MVKPSVDLARKSAELLAASPLSEWNALAVTGRYVAAHEAYAHRKWCSTSAGLYEIFNGVELCCDREGAEWACKGVDAIFKPPLDWVRSAHIKFLSDEKMFREYVIPAVISKRRKGEQAEWDGPPRSAVAMSERFYF